MYGSSGVSTVQQHLTHNGGQTVAIVGTKSTVTLNNAGNLITRDGN